LVELAKERPRWGYRTLWELLRREQIVNAKKVQRLYKLEGLQVRRCRRKRATGVQRVPIAPA
jgi:putative transposase